MKVFMRTFNIIKQQNVIKKVSVLFHRSNIVLIRKLLIGLLFLICSCSPSVYKYKARKEIFRELNKIGLENIDTLVDIGCGFGYYDLEIAHNYPNVFLLLEDIPFLPSEQIIKTYSTRSIWLKHFLKNTNYTPKIEKRFNYISGYPDSIPLSSSSCKMVLCRMTVHEFSQEKKMINELQRILKSDGLIVIMETEPNYQDEIEKTCKNKLLTKNEILLKFSTLKFKSENKEYFKGRTINILTFSK